jgi:hypothetical protein
MSKRAIEKQLRRYDTQQRNLQGNQWLQVDEMYFASIKQNKMLPHKRDRIENNRKELLKIKNFQWKSWKINLSTLGIKSGEKLDAERWT